MCIFCGADPHKDPDTSRTIARGPHTSAIINPDKLRKDLGMDGANDEASDLRERIAEARGLEERGDYQAAIVLWRKLAVDQGGEALSNHIRALESYIHDRDIESTIERANALRRSRRFWTAGRCYDKALRAISKRDPRAPRLTQLMNSCKRSHRRASIVYLLAFVMLGAIGWLVVEPLFERRRVGQEIEALIVQAEGVTPDVPASTWDGLVANHDRLTAQRDRLGERLSTQLEELTTIVESRRAMIGHVLLGRARTALGEGQPDETEDVLAQLADILPDFDPDAVADIEDGVARLRAEQAAAEAALAAAPEAFAAAQALLEAGDRPAALIALEPLQQSLDADIAAQAEQLVTDLRAERSALEDQLDAISALADRDLLAAKRQLPGITAAATAWQQAARVEALSQTIEQRLQGAEQAWLAVRNQPSEAAIEAFLTDHEAAPQSTAARDMLATLQQRAAQREQAIAAYRRARDQGQSERGWQLGRQLVANYPDLRDEVTLPVTVTAGHPGAVLVVDGATVGTADPSGVVTWWRPYQATDLTVRAAGFDDVTIPADAMTRSAIVTVALQRSATWQRNIGFAAEDISDTGAGWVAVSRDRVVSLDYTGAQRWNLHRGDTTAGASEARPRSLSDGRTLVARHDGSLVAVSPAGDQVVVATLEGEIAGQPGTFLNELIGDERLVLISDRLLIGREGSELEQIDLPTMPIRGPAIWSDGLDTLLVLALVDGSLVGVDGANRDIRWRLPLAAADIGQLQALAEQRLLSVLDGSRVVWVDTPYQGSASVLEEVVLGAALVGHPFVTDNQIAIAAGSQVLRFDHSGRAQPPLELSAPVATAPVIIGGATLIAVYQDDRYQLQCWRDDALAWTRELQARPTALAKGAGTCLVIHEDGNALAIEP